jgi:Na+/H+-dicarboxylate symporter
MFKKISLTTKIFIGLSAGITLGLLIYPFREVAFIENYFIGFFLELIGKVFITSIKMLVVPLVFVSLTVGAMSMEDVKKLGRVGFKTFSFYLVTTAVAITIAITLGNLTNPGAGIEMTSVEKASYAIKESKPFIDVIVGMVPRNPFESLSNGNMLQIIVFSLLLGTTLTITGEKTKGIRNLFEEANVVVLKMVDLVMQIAPFGVFCLITKTMATLGYSAMKPLAMYMLTVIGALLLHAIVTYQGMLVLFTRMNPINFLKRFSKVLSVAFSTASSNATIPVTMEAVQDEFGVSKQISSFTIPLGATINMDGTAIMQGVATVFIAQVYGIPLTITDFITVILTATLASIGTAGVPGVGLITLSMILTQVGIPVEGIALIMGIDRILDMIRTAINITGDAVCTLIVAKTEGELYEVETELHSVNA